MEKRLKENKTIKYMIVPADFWLNEFWDEMRTWPAGPNMDNLDDRPTLDVA